MDFRLLKTPNLWGVYRSTQNKRGGQMSRISESGVILKLLKASLTIRKCKNKKKDLLSLFVSEIQLLDK